MALHAQITQEALSTLSPEIQEQYAPVPGQEGVLRLNVASGDSGLVLADVSTLQAELSKQTSALNNLQTQVKQYEGLDPSEARAALTFQQDYAKGNFDDEAKERLKQAEAALVNKYEAQRKALENQLNSTSTAAQEREAKLMSALSRSQVTGALEAEIAKAGGNAHLLTPVLSSRVKLFEEGGEFTTKVIDPSTGDPMFSRKSGSAMEPMSLEEFVAISREDKNYAGAFAGSGNSGGNAVGDGASTSANSVVSVGGEMKVPQSYVGDDHSKFVAVKEQADKQGKTLVFTDD